MRAVAEAQREQRLQPPEATQTTAMLGKRSGVSCHLLGVTGVIGFTRSTKGCKGQGI